MNVLGIPTGPVRRPLVKMTREGIDIVHNALKNVYETSPEILSPIEVFYGISIEKRLNDNELWSRQMYFL